MTRKPHRMSPSKPQPPCDVLILHHHDDYTTAQHLQETVHTLAPNASCRMLTPERVPQETDISSFSVQVWLLVSECAVLDSLMLFYKDELIMKSVTSGRNQFIPVFTKPKDQFIHLPYSLAAYTGLTLANANLNRVISRMLNSAHHQGYKEHLTAVYNHQCSEWAKCEEFAYEEITNRNTQNAVCSGDQNQNEDYINTREEPANQQQRNVFNITINGNPRIHCQGGLNVNTTEAQTKPSEATPGHKDATKHRDTSKTFRKDTQEDVTERKDVTVEDKDDTHSLQSEPIPPKKARWDNVTERNDETEGLDNDDDYDILSLHSDMEERIRNKNEGGNERINIEDLFEGVESESQRTSSGCDGRNIVYNVVIHQPKVVNIGNYH